VLAVLYDVHGNLPALEAVLADASQAGAARFVLGGDYALFGPWPAETVERLRELDATWIRGNGERWTASPSEAPDAEVVQGASVGGIQLVNPGSVGMPFDGDPRAGYALVGTDGEVELRRIGYDGAASAAAVRERFPAFGETVARRIEQAAFAV